MRNILRSVTSLRLHQTSPFVRYGFAIVVSCTGLMLQHYLRPHLGSLPFAILYPVVFSVIVIAGFGPGVLANLIASLTSVLVFIEPHLRLTGETEIAYAKLFVFFMSSLLLSALMERNQRAQQRLTEELTARREGDLERARLHMLMMGAPVIICISRGPEHTVELINQLGRQALNGRDITGQPMAKAVPEIVTLGLIHLLDGVYQSGQPYTTKELRWKIAGSDGRPSTTLYFNVAYQPWHGLDGKIAGLVCFGVDVTDQVIARQKIEDAEERLTLAMQASRQASWDIDLVSKEVTAAQALWSLFGYGKHAARGSKHSDLLAHLLPEDRMRAQEIMEKAIREGTDYINEYRVRWPDGTLHWLASRGRILRDNLGNPCRIVGISYDMTVSKSLELELRRAKEEAENANRLKSTFLANMSHEIRTPLAALLGFTDLLKDQNLSADERTRYVEIMSRNGHQLHHVINDILDLSKVEAGQLRLEQAEVQPFRVAQEVLSLLSVTAQEKSLKLELTADPAAPRSMVTDPARLKQILFNIVGNAVKFTRQGYVNVAIAGRRNADGAMQVVFEISDSGIGIPVAQRERVFESFTQADNSMTRKFGGTGLGLPLSRRLAQMLGGTLTLKSSTEGQGTVFEICLDVEPAAIPNQMLPMSRTAAHSSPTPPSRPAPEMTPTFRLLVVEDSADNRELIRLYLAHAKIEAEYAEDGAEAISKAQQNPYDLIFMDIQMPVLDGYEATQRLRAQGYRHPIVALTAHALSEFRAKGLKAGFTDYLTKPIRRGDILETVARFQRGDTPADSRFLSNN